MDYDYRAGSCPTVERLHFEQMVFTPIVREPLTSADMDDVAAAIRKVLTYRAELV